ncbi:MAG: hypothetical protein IJS32_09635, partial [Kiritimatiellae bacterium]|nr:hypothetical protein [Kiritimatiellia bacterium]
MGAAFFLASSVVRRDRTHLLFGSLGVAAAVALLAWQLGLASTARHQAAASAAAACAPFDCWVTGAPP